MSPKKAKTKSNHKKMGRITIIKMTILPKFLDLFQSILLAPPPLFSPKVRKLLSNFHWNNRKPRLRLSLLYSLMTREDYSCPTYSGTTGQPSWEPELGTELFSHVPVTTSIRIIAAFISVLFGCQLRAGDSTDSSRQNYSYGRCYPEKSDCHYCYWNATVTMIHPSISETSSLHQWQHNENITR